LEIIKTPRSFAGEDLGERMKMQALVLFAPCVLSRLKIRDTGHRFG
jgi:hypothetical protein